MTLLCIDTATEHGMVVAASDDGSMGVARWRSEGRHAENLFGHIDAALESANASRDDVALIGVSVGPGRFTSLRVGLATAKGLALGLDLPIVGVGSLRVIARSVPADEQIVRVPMMNAYRGDVFCAAYVLEGGVLREILSPSFGRPREMSRLARESASGRRIALCGEGAIYHREELKLELGGVLDESVPRPPAASPSAFVAEVEHVRRTDGPADLAALEPQYLRPSDAKLPERRLRTERPG